MGISPPFTHFEREWDIDHRRHMFCRLIVGVGKEGTHTLLGTEGRTGAKELWGEVRGEDRVCGRC